MKTTSFKLFNNYASNFDQIQIIINIKQFHKLSHLKFIYGLEVSSIGFKVWFVYKMASKIDSNFEIVIFSKYFTGLLLCVI